MSCCSSESCKWQISLCMQDSDEQQDIVANLNATSTHLEFQHTGYASMLRNTPGTQSISVLESSAPSFPVAEVALRLATMSCCSSESCKWQISLCKVALKGRNIQRGKLTEARHESARRLAHLEAQIVSRSLEAPGASKLIVPCRAIEREITPSPRRSITSFCQLAPLYVSSFQGDFT
jgi:hypothetical protein